MAWNIHFRWLSFSGFLVAINSYRWFKLTFFIPRLVGGHDFNLWVQVMWNSPSQKGHDCRSARSRFFYHTYMHYIYICIYLNIYIYYYTYILWAKPSSRWHEGPRRLANHASQLLTVSNLHGREWNRGTIGMSWLLREKNRYSPQNWHGTWKWLVRRPLSFWEGLFWGAMLVSGNVKMFNKLQYHPKHQQNHLRPLK